MTTKERSILLPISSLQHHPRQLCNALNASFIITLKDDAGNKVHIPAHMLDCDGISGVNSICNENDFLLSGKHHKKCLPTKVETNSLQKYLDEEAEKLQSIGSSWKPDSLEAILAKQESILKAHNLPTFANFQSSCDESVSTDDTSQGNDHIVLPLHILKMANKRNALDNFDTILDAANMWMVKKPDVHLLYPSLVEKQQSLMKHIFSPSPFNLRETRLSRKSLLRNMNVKPVFSENVLDLAARFRETRASLAMSQQDVANLFLYLFNCRAHQTHISRFECCHSSVFNTLSMRPYVERFIYMTEHEGVCAMTKHLIQAEDLLTKGQVPLLSPGNVVEIKGDPSTISNFLPMRPERGFESKIRHVFSREQSQKLISLFNLDPNPTKKKCQEMATSMNIDVKRILTWFSNQRYRSKQEAEFQ